MDTIFILMVITGFVMGVLLLRNFKIYKRILIVFGLDLFLYIFHAPMVYVSVVLAYNLWRSKDIDFYLWLGLGMFLSFAILTPMYAYSINKFAKEKKTSKFLLSLLIETILFIVFICIFMLCV